MSVIIKTIPFNNIIEFDSGIFDEWCVFLTRNNAPRFAPTDTHYFTELSRLATKHGHQKIYNDFIKIYTQTTREIDGRVLQLITDIAGSYGSDKTETDIWLTVIYAGMIAEENKANAILKKRVKRLGMYQLLMEKQTPEFAAGFSRGKPWRELDALMKKYGF